METRLTSLEVRFDAISPTLATHADIAKVESTLIKWFAGISIATIAVILSAMSFYFSTVHLGAQQSPQPIIIHIPAPVIATHKN
jgi:hypothetical protein